MAKFPERGLNQKCVYWASPTPDGYGGFTYADPVELDCRWSSSTKVVADPKGKEVVCRAEVVVSQDLDEQGMLYLGELDDLDSSQETDPDAVDEAWRILRFDKVPTLSKPVRYFRKAYL